MTKLFGMIGFGLIAKVHAKILFQKKKFVDILLVKSQKNINDARKFFKNEFSYSPKITSNPEEFFEDKINFLILCSPSQTHFFYLLKAMDKNISVFCEKPLFWENGTNYKEIKKKILQIQKHKKINFLVNTSNSYFIDEILKIKKIKKIKFLKFIFHTNGLNKFSDIGVDLLPHGLSILIRALGFDKISNLTKSISEFFVKYKFIYKNADVQFEFMQGNDIKKKMMIQVNNLTFLRQQNSSGVNYKVDLIEGNGEKIRSLKDPFSIYMDLFLEGFRQHKVDLFNLELMCDFFKEKKL